MPRAAGASQKVPVTAKMKGSGRRTMRASPKPSARPTSASPWMPKMGVYGDLKIPIKKMG